MSWRDAALYAAIFVFASMVKLSLWSLYRSTDFDVHRNWLAITHSTPIQDWYFESTSIWTLDYPPLFAYFEYALSLPARWLEPAMVTTLSAHPYSTPHTILYQRATVVASESVLLLALVHAAGPCRSTALRLLALVIGHAGLVLVDNIHFQYNGLLLGVLVLALTDGLKVVSAAHFNALSADPDRSPDTNNNNNHNNNNNNHNNNNNNNKKNKNNNNNNNSPGQAAAKSLMWPAVRCAVWFTALLLLKHIFLYVALFFFLVLLWFACHPPAGFHLSRLVVIGCTVLLVTAAVMGPLLYAAHQHGALDPDAITDVDVVSGLAVGTSDSVSGRSGSQLGRGSDSVGTVYSAEPAHTPPQGTGPDHAAPRNTTHTAVGDGTQRAVGWEGVTRVLRQLGSRLFPFKRGLLHSYWAPNLWALYTWCDVVLGWATATHTSSQQQVRGVYSGLLLETKLSVLPAPTPLICAALSLVGMLPAVVGLFRQWRCVQGACAGHHTRSLSSSPASSQTQVIHSFFRAYTVMVLSSFMLQWHVHEKAILLASVVLCVWAVVASPGGSLLPAGLRACVLVAVAAGNLSLFPLIPPGVETPVKVTLALAHYLTCVWLLPSGQSMHGVVYVYLWSLPGLWVVVDVVLPWCLPRMAFLPLMLVSGYCAVGLLGVYVFLSVQCLRGVPQPHLGKPHSA